MIGNLTLSAQNLRIAGLDDRGAGPQTRCRISKGGAMTRVELYLTKADPNSLYTDGAVEDVKGSIIQDHVKAQLGSGDVVTLKSGFYTYLFSVNAAGTITIQAIDADTHAPLQVPKPIDATQHQDGRTYSFVVP